MWIGGSGEWGRGMFLRFDNCNKDSMTDRSPPRSLPTLMHRNLHLHPHRDPAVDVSHFNLHLHPHRDPAVDASHFNPHLHPHRDPAVDVSHFKDHGAHILVGTPGRIDDIMKRCTTMEFKRLEVCPRWRGTWVDYWNPLQQWDGIRSSPPATPPLTFTQVLVLDEAPLKGDLYPPPEYAPPALS